MPVADRVCTLILSSDLPAIDIGLLGGGPLPFGVLPLALLPFPPQGTAGKVDTIVTGGSENRISYTCSTTRLGLKKDRCSRWQMKWNPWKRFSIPLGGVTKVGRRSSATVAGTSTLGRPPNRPEALDGWT